MAATASGEQRAAPVLAAYAVSPIIKGLAGSLGGVAEACALQPIDVIKTRLQLDSGGKYKGIYHCGNTIVAEEGARSLWKGLTPFATHLTLKYALRMGSNSVYQGLLRDGDGRLSGGRRMAAGFMAGITEALLIVTPFEVVKIRLQQQKGLSKEALHYKGPLHCAATIVREEGAPRPRGRALGGRGCGQRAPPHTAAAVGPRPRQLAAAAAPPGGPMPAGR